MKGIAFLKTAIMQLEGEIADDVAIIKAIVDDPAIAAIDPASSNPGTNIAYAIHTRLHHLGQHKHALQQAYLLLAELEGDGDDKSES